MTSIKKLFLSIIISPITLLASFVTENIDSLECQKKTILEFVQEKNLLYNLSINVDQSRIFGKRTNPCEVASSGLSFCPPDQCIKVALNLPFALDEKCGNWQIAYHGTSYEAAFSIAKNGFDPKKTRQGKAYGPGIYVTPSWNIATQWTCDDVKTKSGDTFGAILQCRVRPPSFKKYPLTWENPPVSIEINHDVCEMVVEKPEDIVVYGILFKKDPHIVWDL